VGDGYALNQEEEKRMMHTQAAAFAAWVLVAASSTHAALLNLQLDPYPDITAGFIDLEYDAGAGALTASGFALTLFDGSNSHIISGGAGLFNISAQIDSSGTALGGSLQIEGTVLGFGPLLLTGELIDFGFMPGGGDLFEFLFTVTGGDLGSPAYYGGAGSIFGVILNANGSTFNGDWGQSFNNNLGIPGYGLGVADIATVPAPAGLPFLLAAALGSRRRRRSIV
jgi:hypothetical protein